MTQINEKYLRAEIEALHAMGLHKEAMEKEAFLGTALKLGLNSAKTLGNKAVRGLSLGANKATNFMKSGPKASKFGLNTAKRADRKIDLLGKQRINLLNQRQNRLHAGKQMRNVSMKMPTSPRPKQIGGNPTGRSRRAERLGSKTPTKPLITPGSKITPVKPQTQTVTTPAASTQQMRDPIIFGPNTPKVTQTVAAPKTTTMPNTSNAPFLPGKSFTPKPNPSKYKRVDTNLMKQKPNVKKTPTMPTTQEKTWDWMQKNPVLAAGGGLLGYKTLANNNNDNIVIGR